MSRREPHRHDLEDVDRSSSSRLFLACLIVFVVAATLYLRTLGHDFVWDDRSILMANPAIGDWSKIGENLTSGFFQESYGSRTFDYWRPLVVLSHMVDRSLFGAAAWGPHLVNVLLHALASVFVLLLAYAWMPLQRLALVSGLLFATHPVHVEVVAWVSGRSDLLFGLGFSLALLADRLYGASGRRRWLGISLAAFVAALASKEAAIVFPLLVAVRAFLTSERTEGSSRWPRTLTATLTAPLASLIALAGYLWIRFALVGVAAPAAVADSAQRAAFWTWWSGFLRYLELLVAPWRLTILHDLELADGLLAPRVLAGILAFTVLAAGVWRLRRSPPAAFAMATLLVCLVPLSNFVYPVTAQGGASFPLAERFLYVPSIGFCVAMAWLLTWWLPARLQTTRPCGTREGAARPEFRPSGMKTWERSAVGLLPILLILAAGARAHVRIGDWSSDLTLFSTAVRNSPGSYLAHLNYASSLASEAALRTRPVSRQNLLDASLRHYLAALELAPENARIHYDLGNLYNSLGHHDEAEAAYRQALLYEPGLAQARINLGALLAQRGALDAALIEFEAAAEALPRTAAPKVNTAHVLQMLGRHQEAISLYREALFLEPGLEAAALGLERAREALSEAE